MTSVSESQSVSMLFFDPEQNPENVLKTFNDFTQMFELRYDAQYPDPPKVSMDSAIERWKFANGTEDNPNPRPSLAQYDQIRAEWRSRDRVAKFLGMFSSRNLYTDWLAAETSEAEREKATWNHFLTKMREYYKPTENPTLQNYHFRDVIQNQGESFTAFCNRVDKEAKHCFFNCPHPDCTATQTAVRDQILIGTSNKEIRDEALLRGWNLATLRKEGMKMECCKRWCTNFR